MRQEGRQQPLDLHLTHKWKAPEVGPSTPTNQLPCHMAVSDRCTPAARPLP
jgi:hypothetical protein